MKLTSVFVYDVLQQRTAEENEDPKGGACALSEDFIKSMEKFSAKQAIENRPTIQFDRPRKGRKHLLREHLMAIAFGSEESKKSNAFSLASKLALAMDERTSRVLLLIVVHADEKNEEKCQVTMWAFPKDEPIQFNSTKMILRNVSNAFTKRSTFAKCARFTGVNSDQSFWRGYVIDRTTKSGLDPARYWTKEFLQGSLTLTSQLGTQHLSQAFSDLIQNTESNEQRSELANAVVGIRASKRETWSLADVAAEFLSDESKESFLELIPVKEREAEFKIDSELFDSLLGRRVFTTDDGVIISTPFDDPESTKIRYANGRISVDGHVVQEAFAKEKKKGKRA
jgi:hypothetical protein